MHQNSQLRSIHIGDDVEDILNLAYTLLSDDFHKIDMRFFGCCTLKNSNVPGGKQYETAAINTIQRQIQHNSATAIQKRIRGFLARNNQQPTDSNS